MSLEELRADFFLGVKGKGVNCPCCDRWAKVNGFLFNRSMARSLVWLVRKAGPVRRFVDVTNEASAEMRLKGQLTKNKYWHLIEPRKNKDPKKKTSGFWRPTETGVRFANNLIKIQTMAHVYDDNILGYGPNTTLISDIYEHFHYAKHMEGTYNNG